MDVYRVSGNADYLLRIIVPSINAYDALYKELIARVELAGVVTTIVMENIRVTTELPVGLIGGD